MRALTSIEQFDPFSTEQYPPALFISFSEKSPVVSPEKLNEVASYSSSRGSQQADFRRRVLTRDGRRCVFCDVEENLEAAHLIDFAEKNTDEGFLQIFSNCNISGTNDTPNGICLCGACHDVFDAHLVSINPDTQTLEVAECLLSSREFGLKWSQIQGKVISPRTRCGAWISDGLIRRQFDLFREKTNSRHDTARLKPFVCNLCDFRCASQGGLTRHTKSGACQTNQQEGQKLSMLHTPSK